MSRGAKIALWTGAGVVTLVALLIAALFIVPNTQSGRDLIVRKVAELSNDRVRIAGIQGTFPANLSLDRLELRDREGLWLWADHVSVQWTPSALLRRHIDVAAVHFALLHVERAPLPDPDEPPSKSSSSLPRTDVGELVVQTLELGPALAGAPTALTVKADVHLQSLDELTAHLTARRIEGNGDYEVDAQLTAGAINATLQAQEPPQGPLASLVNLPTIGAIRMLATLKGPRTAEQLELSVDAGPLQARASGQLNLQQLAADLSYSVTAPAMSPADGLRWEQIDLQGQLHGPLAQLAANGHLLVKSLEAPGGVRLGLLDAQLAGDRGALSLKAGIDNLQIPGPAPKLLKDSRLSLDAGLRLDDPKRPLVLNVSHRLFGLEARAVTADHPSADLTLRVPDLKPFSGVAGMPLRGDAQVAAQVDYTPAVTRLTADISTRLDPGAAAWAGLVRGGVTKAQLSASLTEQRVDVEKLRVTAAAMALNADARINRTGEQALSGHFDLSLPNLKRVADALAGELKVAGSFDGPKTRLSADTRITTNVSIHGSARSTLSARLQAKGLPQAPQATFTAEGDLDGAPLQVNVEVSPANAGQYRAVIHRANWKSASAQGDVTFGSADPRGTAQFVVGDLGDFNRLAAAQLKGALQGHAVLAAQSGKPSAQLDVEATQIVAGDVTANAKLSATGPLDALGIELEGDSLQIGGGPARVTAAAVLNATAKELQLSRLELFAREQAVKLLQPARLQFAQGLSVQSLKLGLQEASLELDGQLSPTFDFRAALRNVQPKLINAFVPDALATGTASVDATIRGTSAAPEGTVRLQALNLRAKNSQAKGLPPTDVRATANLKDGAADLDAHLTAGDTSQVTLTGRAPLSSTGDLDLKLAGALNLALANPLLEASGRHVTGNLAIDTTIRGPAGEPDIGGTVRISNGSVRDYGQGLSLTDIQGELAGGQGVLTIQSLTARAAPGTVSIEGTVGVAQPNLPVDIRLVAKNAQPIASNIVTANLDANVQLSGNAREALDLKGKIHLNRADVTIPGGLPPEVAVLDVERPGDKPASAQARPLVTRLHIDVEAPNRILIKGRGLDAEMGGDLKIRGTDAAPEVEGGFELQRGFFTLANSKLRFTSGTVTFNGNGVQRKIDPSLDFTAQSKAAEVTAVVHITGVADAPKIELTSTPELPQDEILARLLFGQPAAQLSALELVETGVALASLRGGSNGPSLNPLDRIQKALGLDRLSVASASSSSGTSSTDQKSGTSIEAGRYVSSRVYVGVKEGTTGSSQVNVDVDLTKSLKLQAQLGNGSASAQGVTPENDPGSSLGLAYQFEY